MLFASVVFEKEPLTWAQFPQLFGAWLQNAGGVAAFGIFLVLIARYLDRGTSKPNLLAVPFLRIYGAYILFANAILFGFLFLCWIGGLVGIGGARYFIPRQSADMPLTIGDWILTVAGTIALFIALTPIVLDFTTRFHWSRIWAIARLSWKEAVRGRIIWVFGSMALVFLFADWLVPYKAEDQVRNYVRVVFWSMTPLFLITAGLLGSFSIPNDVKNNSIHTIVTKPVEKFEIVLGRFLGFAGLLTIGLFITSSVSLLYVVRGVNEEAARESYKARVPIYGKLSFAGTKKQFSGTSVGREWSYRSYITGPTKRAPQAFRQYAIWDFADMPSFLPHTGGDGKPMPVLFEFQFDIFRLSKGDEEGKGVFGTFTFTDGTRDAPHLGAALQEIQVVRTNMETAALKKKDTASIGKTGAEKVAVETEYRKELEDIKLELARKYRIFQKTGVEVSDGHTQDEVMIPPEIFKLLLTDVAARKGGDGPPLPVLRAFFSVDAAQQAQMVGVSPWDFYLVAAEKPFWQNFLKGVLGMWCTHMLVLGVAIACSTYLSSVISLLGTMFLFLTGLFVDYLREIAEKKLDQGGPVESLSRITKRTPIAVRLPEESPTTVLIKTTDDVFSWWIGRLLNLIPDVNRHDLHKYVANGFDIPWLDVLMLDNFLPLAGYLVPWAVLAYYLMKYREIANPS